MKKKYLELVVVSSLIVLFTNCATLKPKGASKTGKKLFETFYLGEQGTQYFIKPIGFSNDIEKLKLDFTLRENDAMATVNFSLIGNIPIDSVDSFVIENSKEKLIVRQSKLLYKEREKDFFESRFSAKVERDKLKGIFEDASWRIFIDKLVPFKTKKHTEKSLADLYNHVFILLKN